MADLKCGDIYTHRDLFLHVARTLDGVVFLQVLEKNGKKKEPVAHIRLRKGEALYLLDKLKLAFEGPSQDDLFLTQGEIANADRE